MCVLPLEYTLHRKICLRYLLFFVLFWCSFLQILYITLTTKRQNALPQGNYQITPMWLGECGRIFRKNELWVYNKITAKQNTTNHEKAGFKAGLYQILTSFFVIYAQLFWFR